METALAETLKKNPTASAQIFVWDDVQAKHIRRLMERHLETPEIQDRFMHLIWLFPPESVMENPEVEKASPVTVVKPVLRQLAGLPLEYSYTLLGAARVYCAAKAAP